MMQNINFSVLSANKQEQLKNQTYITVKKNIKNKNYLPPNINQYVQHSFFYYY
jgi:hypothetical protein